MPFTFPNVTLYKDDVYRVCHSPEEFAALSPKGWGEESQAGVTYQPLSATWKLAPRFIPAAIEPVAHPIVIHPAIQVAALEQAAQSRQVVIEPEQVKAQVTKK